MDTTSADALRQDIAAWVSDQLSSYEYRFEHCVTEPKLVRDGVWDSHLFQPYEVHILDCPIVQRLRGISQTALASHIYPSATHTRFQHTLGTVMVAELLARAISERAESTAGLFGDTETRALRLAALLHDVGHGIFSHASEVYYGRDSGIEQVKEELGLPEGAKPHEVLSYLIVTSKPFVDFLERVFDAYKVTSIPAEQIGGMIVGLADGASSAYLRDLINGVFDVDKLDYISRDAHSTGIKMVIDLDRIAYTMSVAGLEHPNTGQHERRIAIDLTGVPAIEQVIFNKLLLTTSVYHHHKVRAVNCILWGLFDVINRAGTHENRGMALANPLDFLCAMEAHCLDSQDTAGETQAFIEALSERKLLKRALVISRRTLGLETEDEVAGFYDVLEEIDEDPETLRLLRALLFEEAEKQNLTGGYSVDYFWFDFPDVPKFKEPSQCIVRHPDGETTFMTDVFRVDQWSEAYFDNKWKGHVFCPPDLDRAAIGRIAADILNAVYDLDLSEDAISQAKC